MGLKRIHIGYYSPNSFEIVSWFCDTFGAPQEWNGTVLEPEQLKSGYQWASGRNTNNTHNESWPCIWCTEQAYTLYSLRWSNGNN